MALYEILPGRRDSLVIEPYRYLRGRVSVYGKQKYLSDYFRRFRVDGKLVSNRRMQYISPHFTAKTQIIEADGVVLLDIISVHTPPTTNRSGFLR